MNGSVMMILDEMLGITFDIGNEAEREREGSREGGRVEGDEV